MLLNEFRDFKEALNKYNIDPNPQERKTLCHLVWLDEMHNGPHIFEVRSMFFYKSKIAMSVVNWTIAGGTANLDLTVGNFSRWKILEEDKTLQVLYGR